VLTELQVKQRKDHSVVVMMSYLEKCQLPSDTKQAHIVAANSYSCCILHVDGILHLINRKC